MQNIWGRRSVVCGTNLFVVGYDQPQEAEEKLKGKQQYGEEDRLVDALAHPAVEPVKKLLLPRPRVRVGLALESTTLALRFLLLRLTRLFPAVRFELVLEPTSRVPRDEPGPACRRPVSA